MCDWNSCCCCRCGPFGVIPQVWLTPLLFKSVLSLLDENSLCSYPLTPASGLTLTTAFNEPWMRARPKSSENITGACVRVVSSVFNWTRHSHMPHLSHVNHLSLMLAWRWPHRCLCRAPAVEKSDTQNSAATWQRCPRLHAGYNFAFSFLNIITLLCAIIAACWIQLAFWWRNDSATFRFGECSCSFYPVEGVVLSFLALMYSSHTVSLSPCLDTDIHNNPINHF